MSCQGSTQSSIPNDYASARAEPAFRCSARLFSFVNGVLTILTTRCSSSPACAQNEQRRAETASTCFTDLSRRNAAKTEASSPRQTCRAGASREGECLPPFCRRKLEFLGSWMLALGALATGSLFRQNQAKSNQIKPEEPRKDATRNQGRQFRIPNSALPPPCLSEGDFDYFRLFATIFTPPRGEEEYN